MPLVVTQLPSVYVKISV